MPQLAHLLRTPKEFRYSQRHSTDAPVARQFAIPRPKKACYLDTERWYWLSGSLAIERAKAEAPRQKSQMPTRIMKGAKSSPLIYPNQVPVASSASYLGKNGQFTGEELQVKFSGDFC
jgi:hypothetical protein